MTIISYAQNYEDVMLWRALGGVRNGFYIDVGAAWPDEHSVTKLFYLNGWRGINIEPNPKFNQMLIGQRSEDINLKVALSDHEGRVMIKIISDTGLSTISQEIAKMHRQNGWVTQEEEVRLTTLASVCKEFVKPDQQIHFLKVDVEGLEEAVLRGNDWVTFRPWVVLVEATLPMGQVESYEGWEPLLLNAEYVFVYADGLNRFYVANDHPELFEVFKYPPNVFDGFRLISQVEAEAKTLEAETRTQQAKARAQQAEAKTLEAETRTQQAKARAQQAEAKTLEAETRAQQAEAKTLEAETRAQQAEAKTLEAETRTQQAEAKTLEAETRAQQAEAKTLEAETRTQQAEAKTLEAETRTQQAEAKTLEAETRAQQAEIGTQEALIVLRAVYASKSWRITAPLRGLATFLKKIYYI
jgi:FkbM family methyltransferase